MATAYCERDDDHTWRVLKALGHPVRLEIVRFIQHHPNCICNEILLQLPDRCTRAQSTLSQHLKILRDAGIIEAEQDGSTTSYLLNEEQIAWLNDQLCGLLDQVRR